MMKIIKQLSFLLLITCFVVNPAFSQENLAPLKNKKVDSKIIQKVPKEETTIPSKQMKATKQVDLSGCWQNSFGSIVLLSHDLNTGEITGKYSSTTGSSAFLGAFLDIKYYKSITKSNSYFSNFSKEVINTWQSIS